MPSLITQDQDELRTLFNDVNPYLFRFLIAHGIYKEHAEDLVQQTWEQFFVSQDKFEGRSHVKTYLTGILLNKIREKRRKEARIDYEDDSERMFARAFDGSGHWTHRPEDPQKLSELKQLNAWIRECLEGLSEQQKTVFTMIELEDEESSLICNKMGISATHLRVLLFRAKEKLKSCLNGKSQ